MIRLVYPVVLLLVLATTGTARELTSAEQRLLERLVIAEAQSEGELGMALVARSVLNRTALLESRTLPTGTYLARGRTLRGVVYGRMQYEPVGNGSIDRRRSAASLRAARRAIALARDTAGLTAALRRAGVGSAASQRLLRATGFRTASAYRDRSQNYDRQVFRRHVFNSDRFSRRHDVPALFERTFASSRATRSSAAAAPAGRRSLSARSAESLPAAGRRTTAARGGGASAAPAGRRSATNVSGANPSAPALGLADRIVGASGASRPARASGAPGASAATVGPATSGPREAEAGASPSTGSSPEPQAWRPRSALGRAILARGPMRSGARGALVKQLQRWIGGVVTGFFGLPTKNDLKAWQRRNGLEATGVCDVRTARALEGSE